MMRTKARMAALLFASVIVCGLLLAGCAKKEPPAETESLSEGKETSSGFRVGYAVEGVTELDDTDALTKALDDAYKETMESRIALDYQNEARSSNGIDFSCHIGNSSRNVYDLFIAIYSDLDYTDELYLSQLLRPGTAFEKITLNHPLEPGTHEVYVVYSLVDDADGEQVIKGQLTIAMDFIVSPE